MTQTDLANLALAKLGSVTIRSLDDTTVKEAVLAKLHFAQALDEVLRAHFWGFAMASRALGAEAAATITISGLVYYSASNGIYALQSALINGRIQYLMPDAGYGAGAIYWDGAAWLITLDEVTVWSSAEDVATPDLVAAWVAALGGETPLPVASLAAEILPWTTAYAMPADFLKLRLVLRPDGSAIDKFDLRRANSKRCLVTRVSGGVMLQYVARVSDPAEYDPLFTAALVTLLASKLARPITGSDAMEGQLRGIYVNEDLPAARMADGQDTQSAENHPLAEMLAGSLTGSRANFFPDSDDC